MTSTSRARAQAASAAGGPYRFASPISRQAGRIIIHGASPSSSRRA